MTESFLPTPTFGHFQNPGYEYLLGIYWMKEVQVVSSTKKTRYYLPAKALLSACNAIDGYVNIVGTKVDPYWKTIDEEETPIKERLSRIYKSLKLPVDLNQGVWKNVLRIFHLRMHLSRYALADVYDAKDETVPAIFKVVSKGYPIRLTHAIAEEAIELLLSISE